MSRVAKCLEAAYRAVNILLRRRHGRWVARRAGSDGAQSGQLPRSAKGRMQQGCRAGGAGAEVGGGERGAGNGWKKRGGGKTRREQLATGTSRAGPSDSDSDGTTAGDGTEALRNEGGGMA